jgi:hypothetical protein
MHAIATSGSVSRNSLPESPNRRGSLSRGGCSVVGWSSVTDTLSPSLDLLFKGCGPSPHPVKLRIANVIRFKRCRSAAPELPSSPSKHRKNQTILGDYDVSKKAR